ncbi:hypothetical protein [Lactiplantibacillus carotarum]|uniref:hypothetical protein n=1 Tax=Lactiplantibacillus carotarum TaxID=2993456 RepID=UPI00298ED440|nr:hypothetical protein [Lactiplantibacillus carotarum]
MLRCQNCGRPLKRPDRAYFLLRVPRNTVHEVRSFLEVNSVVYCPECIQVMRTKSLT